MTSDGRLGTSLLRARSRGEVDLQRLLAQVADHWTVSRYQIYELNSQWHFASLWDWDRPGGYVHVSPYEPGKDVRTTESINITWSDNSAAPPPAFTQAVEAYKQLAPTKVLASSEG